MARAPGHPNPSAPDSRRSAAASCRASTWPCWSSVWSSRCCRRSGMPDGADHGPAARAGAAAGTAARPGPARRPGAGRAARRAAQPARRQPHRRAHLRRRPGPALDAARSSRSCKRHGAVATFCMVSKNAAGHEALVRQVVDAGMRLCDHSRTHDELLPERDPERIADEVVGAGAPCPRPRAGRPSSGSGRPAATGRPRSPTLSAEHGMQPLSWNVDPRDWERPGADAIVAAVQQQIGSRRPTGRSCCCTTAAARASRPWTRWRS